LGIFGFKQIPDDISALETVQALLTGEEIEMKLQDINYSLATFDLADTLTTLAI